LRSLKVIFEEMWEYIDSNQKSLDTKLEDLADELRDEYKALQHKFVSVQQGQESTRTHSLRSYTFGEIKEEIDKIKMALMDNQVYLLYL
jgi:methionine synthase II (cobalamin-independent)